MRKLVIYIITILILVSSIPIYADDIPNLGYPSLLIEMDDDTYWFTFGDVIQTYYSGQQSINYTPPYGDSIRIEFTPEDNSPYIFLKEGTNLVVRRITKDSQQLGNQLSDTVEEAGSHQITFEVYKNNIYQGQKTSWSFPLGFTESAFDTTHFIYEKSYQNDVDITEGYKIRPLQVNIKNENNEIIGTRAWIGVDPSVGMPVKTSQSVIIDESNPYWSYITYDGGDTRLSSSASSNEQVSVWEVKNESENLPQMEQIKRQIQDEGYTQEYLHDVPQGTLIEFTWLSGPPVVIGLVPLDYGEEPYSEDERIVILSPNNYKITTYPVIEIEMYIRKPKIELGSSIYYTRNGSQQYKLTNYETIEDTSTFLTLKQKIRFKVGLIGNTHNSFEFFWKSPTQVGSGMQAKIGLTNFVITQKTYVDNNGIDESTGETPYQGFETPLNPESSNNFDFSSGSIPDLSAIVANLTSSVGQVAVMVGGFFTFLPPEITGIIIAGLAVLVVLRVLGR